MSAAQSIKLLKSIDSACDRFERDWLAGQQPRLEDYLAEVPSSDRPALLDALMQVQQELILSQFESQEDSVEFSEATADETNDGDVISGGTTALELMIDDPAQTLDGRSDSVVSPVAPATRPSTCEGAEALPKVPGYEIFETLSRTPLGTTYRARQNTTELERTIKILKPSHQASERGIQMFLREARILSLLNHRNLIRLVDTGAVNGALYLVTESVSVLPWDNVLAKAAPESRVRMACGVACQILDGLQYAHTRSLVHRDIQPSNILVVRQDHKLIAKLADFGFAKCYIDAGFSQITHDGAIIGSLPYLSPEQFMDSRHAKPSCDIYSMGATLYRLLAGHDPIVFNNSRCKFLAILEDDPIPLRQSFPQVPATLAAIVHRALAKQPADRFSSAAEMRYALLPFSRRSS